MQRVNSANERGTFHRCCLSHGWLSSLVMSLRTWKEVSAFYDPDALLLKNPNESVMSACPQLDVLHFDLYLGNRGFLDFGWELPVYKRFELVPCSDLGLMICSVKVSYERELAHIRL